MSKKTRKQRRLAEEKKQKSTGSNSVVSIVNVSTEKEPIKETPKYNKNRYEYKETDYDKDLRRFTIRDIIKTGAIIVALFVVQYVIYLNFAPGK